MKRPTCLGLVLAVVAAPHAALPQSAPSLPTDDAFSSVADEIQGIESSQGINSADLIRPLTTLGLFLREQGDIGPAVAVIERARHLVRVNYGLTSFEEAPLLRQLVQIEERKGNAAAAWDLEQQLIDLIYLRPNARAAPMLREIADKRLDVLERYSAGTAHPPQIALGCYYAPPQRSNYTAPTANVESSCSGGNRHRVKQALDDEARRYYLDAFDMTPSSERRSADALAELDLALLRLLYANRNDYGTEDTGRGALRVAHSRTVKYSKPLPVQANALVQLADWDLLYAAGRKENAAAFQANETLYAHLEQQGLEQRFIDELFSPSVPVVLPAFSPNPLASSDTPDSSGYIDVAFEITKYGKSEAIEILATTTSTSNAAGARLVELIENRRFRPRIAAGAFEDPSRVVVRYFVSD